MRILWSDRLGWLKFAAAVAAVTALSYHARSRLTDLHPSLGAIRMYPEANEGKTAFVAPGRIREGGRGRFVVEKDDLPLVVHAAGDWQAGETVAVRGTVRGGELVAHEIRRYRSYFWRRAMMYGVSILLVLFVGWRMLRRTRLDRGVFESRY